MILGHVGARGNAWPLLSKSRATVPLQVRRIWQVRRTWLLQPVSYSRHPVASRRNLNGTLDTRLSARKKRAANTTIR